MTDEQIIKALTLCTHEFLGCEDGCPYFGKNCRTKEDLLKDALDLIKRQKAEIERLQDKIHKMFEYKVEVSYDKA